MVALTRPGGVVALHEADGTSHVCDPPLPAFDRLFELFVTYARMNGMDPFIGRRVPRMLWEAGLVDIRVNPLIHVYPPGHRRRSIFLDHVENLRDRLLKQNLIEERELTELLKDLKRHLDDRRVARGGCPPRAPTDPYVRDYRIRLLGAGTRCETVHTVSHPLTLRYPLEFR